MTDELENRRFRERAERLVKLIKMDAPDWIIAREFFLIERSVRAVIDDKVIRQAKFEIELDPAVDDDRIKGFG